MADHPYWEDVDEGSQIPPLVKRPTTRQLVRYAGVSGDFYEIHYDKDFAKSTGLSGVILHGALKSAFLGQMLTDWIGPNGTLRKLGCQYRGMDEPGIPPHLRRRSHQEVRLGGAALAGLRHLGGGRAGPALHSRLGHRRASHQGNLTSPSPLHPSPSMGEGLDGGDPPTQLCSSPTRRGGSGTSRSRPKAKNNCTFPSSFVW